MTEWKRYGFFLRYFGSKHWGFGLVVDFTRGDRGLGVAVGPFVFGWEIDS